jgi:hypothetical protein
MVFINGCVEGMVYKSEVVLRKKPMVVLRREWYVTKPMAVSRIVYKPMVVLRRGWFYKPVVLLRRGWYKPMAALRRGWYIYQWLCWGEDSIEGYGEERMV